MVKQVVRWKASDGSLFDSEQDCKDHEQVNERIQLIREELHRDPDEWEIYEFINKYTKGWK